SSTPFVSTVCSQALMLSGGLVGRNYRTPRSMQMNIGIQREVRRDLVLSADCRRNVNLLFLLGVELNHVGDARFFNRANALDAISSTNNSFGCGAETDVASINCAIANGATIAEYAGNGLTSANDFGGACSFCAFRGVNPSAASLFFQFRIGRSLSNALQLKIVQYMK